MDKKCLVTGGAGFIGSHLVNRLIQQGYRVVVIDNLSAGKKENLEAKAEFYNADICNMAEIAPLFEKIDYVFHLAAMTKVPLSIQEPAKTSQTNIIGTLNVFKAAADHKVQRVIFSSSSAVYGDQEHLPLKETMAPNPKSPYGLQKLVGEQAATLFLDLYHIPIVSLRYFNVYGPRVDLNSDYSSVLGKFLTQKAQKKPLTIFGDGKQTRAFCYVQDIADANIKAMESKNIKGGEVINISQEDSYTVNDISRLIGGEVEYLPVRMGDIRHSQADISLAKNLLGWQPKVSFLEGIELTKQWFDEKKI